MGEPKLKRQSWMLEPDDGIIYYNKKRDLKERPQKEFKVSKYELNPYFNNGGNGLPLDKDSESSQSSKSNSWEKVKIKRMLEHAKSEGLSIEQVALQRYGSLDEFYKAAKFADVDVGSSSKITISERVAALQSNNDSNVVVVDNSEDDINSLLLKERLDTKSMHLKQARGIIKDSKFQDSLDYLDTNADKLAKDVSTSDTRTAVKREECKFCVNDESSKSISVISCGYHVYLGLLSTKPLVNGHCVIVPLEHYATLLECEEEEWNEIRNYMKSLTKTFHSQGKGTLFFETFVNVRGRSHAFMECVPVPYDIYDQARAYFKNAILAIAEDWSTNKKLIETSRSRGIRKVLVKQIPYFHVWLTIDDGYAHIIEDETKFPKLFGREIIGGMLNISKEKCLKPSLCSKEEKDSNLSSLIKIYEKFDWAKALR